MIIKYLSIVLVQSHFCSLCLILKRKIERPTKEMCETNVHDSDAKDCDPQLRTNDNVSKQKAIYIDEALGKISKGICLKLSSG